MPTKRLDVSKQHTNVGERLNAAGHWKIRKIIVSANEDALLRTLTYQRCGGPGRTRTCNQTVMSGGISIGFVDFAAFSFVFDRVCRDLFALFLVRNWCG
jgi:hypothetical protein